MIEYGVWIVINGLHLYLILRDKKIKEKIDVKCHTKIQLVLPKLEQHQIKLFVSKKKFS